MLFIIAIVIIVTNTFIIVLYDIWCLPHYLFKQLTININIFIIILILIIFLFHTSLLHIERLVEDLFPIRSVRMQIVLSFFYLYHFLQCCFVVLPNECDIL